MLELHVLSFVAGVIVGGVSIVSLFCLVMLWTAVRVNRLKEEDV